MLLFIDKIKRIHFSKHSKSVDFQFLQVFYDALICFFKI